MTLWEVAAMRDAGAVREWAIHEMTVPVSAPDAARLRAAHDAAGRPNQGPRGRDHDYWYRSPILWLGAALLAASIAGCIVTVLLALRHADPSVPVGTDRLLNVPAVHAPLDDADVRTPPP